MYEYDIQSIFTIFRYARKLSYCVDKEVEKGYISLILLFVVVFTRCQLKERKHLEVEPSMRRA